MQQLHLCGNLICALVAKTCCVSSGVSRIMAKIHDSAKQILNEEGETAETAFRTILLLFCRARRLWFFRVHICGSVAQELYEQHVPEKAVCV
jgi:hypothetical protein